MRRRFGLPRCWLLAFVAFLAVSGQAAAAPFSWTAAATGFYDIGTNWTPGGPPGAGDDATISATGAPYTVTLRDSRSINTLTLNSANATFSHTAGTLTVASGISLQAGTYSLNGGTIAGGTLTSSGGILTATANSGNTLSGVQIGANALDMSATGTILRLTNGTNFTALNTIAFGGGGYFRIEQSGTLSNLNLTLGTAAAPSNASLQLYGGQNVTLASTVTITAIAGGTNNNVGRSNNFSDLGTNNLTNQGILQSTAANVTLNINPSGTFTNAVGGQVIASGTGTINLAPTGGWTNQGTITVNNGTLNLTTDFATAGIGTVNRTGGTVNLKATATTAAAGTFDVQSFGGNINLQGGRILSGTLTSTGTARLVPNGDGNNRLDGVMVGLNALDVSASGTILRLLNGTDFSVLNTLAFGGGGYFRIEQSGTLSNLNLTLGTAAAPSNASLQLYGGQNVTLASTVTITAFAGGTNNNVGRSNNFSDLGTNNLTNQGILQATAANVILNINNSGLFTNAAGGQVIASGTGTINLAPIGGWTNQGTITVNNGTLNLNTDFAATGIGTVSRTGGTVNLTATLTATGGFDIQSFGGNLSLTGGGILGGTMTSTGTARLVPNGNGNNRLDGVQVGANALDVSSNGTVLRLLNGANFSVLNTLAFGGGGYFRIEQSSTLSNLNLTLGTAAAPSNASLQLFGPAAGGQNVTLASTVTITAFAGGTNNNVGRSNNFGDSGTNNLTNQGILQATAANVVLNINPSGLFTNAAGGQVIASGTGTINLAPAGGWTNQGTIVVNAGTLNLNSDFAAAGIGTVTRTGGTINLSATLTATGGTFDVQSFGGNLILAGGRILGGTMTSTGTARLVPNGNSNNRLDGVMVGLNALDVSASGTILRLLNGTDFSVLNTLAFGGGGYFRIEQSSTLSNLNLTLGTAAAPSNASLQLFGPAAGGQNVTLASTVTITAFAGGTNNNVGRSNNFGDSGTNNLTNQGILQATAANVVLNINPSGLFTNAAGGQVIASGTGTINLAPAGGWTNQGTIVVNAGTLNLNSDFAAAGIGTVTRTGGTINLSATLTATGGTFDVQSFGGNLILAGGRILGGTMTSTGTARLVPNGNSNNRLDGVMVGLNALDVSASGTILRLLNGTDFSVLNTLAFGGGGYFRIEQSSTLSNLNLTLGTAAAPSNASLQLYGGQDVTLASTVTITAFAGGTNNNVGRSNNFSDLGTNNLTNQGILQATAANVILNINNSGLFTNAVGGQVIASGTGTINLAPAGGWTNQGTITVNNGTLNLTTDFAAVGIGTFARTGGTVNLRATATTAAAGTFDVQSFGGNVNLQGGRVLGGTLLSSGTARLVPNNDGNNRLDGVMVAGNALDLSAANTVLRLLNGTNFSAPATISLGSSSIIRVEQSGTLNNLNLTLGTAAAPSNAALQLYGGQTVTLAPSVTITAGPGTNNNVGRSNNFSDLGTNNLTNQGTLQAIATGTTLNINPSGAFANQGSIVASGGGTVLIPNTPTVFNNIAANTLTGGTYVVNANSTMDFGSRTFATIAAGTSITLNGANSVFLATNPLTTNNGTFNLLGGRSFTITGGTLTNTGTLTVGDSSATTLTGAVINNGSGLLQGSGRITGAVTMNGGTLHPGNSPGVLTVTGPVTLASSSTFDVDIAGAAAGTGGYSQLNLTGGGTINLNGADLVTHLSYAPSANDSFLIINGGAVSGNFNNQPPGSQVTLMYMGNPYARLVIYGPTSVSLSPVPEPAFVVLMCGAASCAIVWWRRRRNLVCRDPKSA